MVNGRLRRLLRKTQAWGYDARSGCGALLYSTDAAAGADPNICAVTNGYRTRRGDEQRQGENKATEVAEASVHRRMFGFQWLEKTADTTNQAIEIIVTLLMVYLVRY